MALPFYVSASTLAATSNSTTVAPIVPNCQTDDILFAVITKDTNASVTPPSGWNLVAQETYGTSYTQALYWQRATATNTPSGSQTFTFDTAGGPNNVGMGIIYVFRDCIKEGDPYEAYAATTGNSGTQTPPAITKTGGIALGVWFDSFGDNVQGSISGSPTYQEWNDQETAVGSDGEIHVWGTVLPVGEGTTTPGTCNHGTASNPWVVQGIALKGEPTPGLRRRTGVTNGTGAITLAPPSGTSWNSYQADDILVAFIETANQSPPTDPPSGWQTVPDAPVGFGTAGAAGSVKLNVYWRRAVGDTSDNLSFGDSGDHQIGEIIAIYGCPTSGSPFEASAYTNQTTASTSVTWPSVTTLGDHRRLLFLLGGSADISSTAQVSAPSNSNVDELIDTGIENWALDGVGGGIYAATATKHTPGSIGTTTATLTTSQTFSVWTAALMPLYVNANLTVDTASITVTAQDAAVNEATVIDVSTVQYNLNTAVATVKEQTTVDVETASAAITTLDVDFIEPTFVLVDTTSIAVTAQAAEVNEAFVLSVDAASIAVSALDADLLESEIVFVDTVAVDVTALDADVLEGASVDVETVAIDVTALDITLSESETVQVDTATITISPLFIGTGIITELDEAYPFFVNPRSAEVRILIDLPITNFETVDVATYDATVINVNTIEAETAEIVVAVAVADVIDNYIEFMDLGENIDVATQDPIVIADPVLVDTDSVLITAFDPTLIETIPVSKASYALTTRDPTVQQITLVDTVEVATRSVLVTPQVPILQYDGGLDFPYVVETSWESALAPSRTHNITLPNNIAYGDLIVILWIVDDVPLITIPAGWHSYPLTMYEAEADNADGRVIYKTSLGNDSGTTVRITTADRTVPWFASGEQSSGYRVLVFRSAYGPPFIETDALYLANGTENTGPHTTGVLNPTTWNTEKTTWMTVAVADRAFTNIVFTKPGYTIENYYQASTSNLVGGDNLYGSKIGVATFEAQVESTSSATITYSVPTRSVYRFFAIRPAFANPETIFVDTSTVAITTQQPKVNEKIIPAPAAITVETQICYPQVKFFIPVDTGSVDVATQDPNINAVYVDRVGNLFIDVVTRATLINEKRIVEIDTASIAVDTQLALTSGDELWAPPAAAINVTMLAANTKADEGIPIDVASVSVATYDATANERERIDVDTASYTFASYEIAERLQIVPTNIVVTTFESNTKEDENIPVDVQSFALTTYDWSLNEEEIVFVDTAAYALTLFDVGVTGDDDVFMDAASIAVSAQPATINAAFVVPVTTRAFAVTTAIPFVYDDYIEFMDTAAVDVTTFDARVFENFRVETDTASISVTTEEATVNAAYVEPVTAATYAVTTKDVEVYEDFVVFADSESITITTQPTTTFEDEVIFPAVASILVATQAATINASTIVDVDVASVVVETKDANTKADYIEPVDTGSIAITTEEADTVFDEKIRVDTDAIVVTSLDAMINAAFVVSVDTAEVNSVTYPVVINEAEFIAVLTDSVDVTAYDVSFVTPFLAYAVTAVTYNWELESSYYGTTRVEAVAVRTAAESPPSPLFVKKQAEWIKPLVQGGP